MKIRFGKNLCYKYIEENQNNDLPEPNPKRNKLARAIARINNPGYGRFMNYRSFLPLCFRRVKDVITDFDSDIIDYNKLLILANTNGLHTAKYFDDLTK